MMKIVMAAAILGLCLVSCTNNLLTVSKAEYPTKIIGTWHGTVGNLKETMKIMGDGNFVCRLHPGGFVSNMIYPTVPGTVRGTWKINGAIIILSITGDKNENLMNRISSSTIVAFKEEELVLKSAQGEISTFLRVNVL